MSKTAIENLQVELKDSLDRFNCLQIVGVSSRNGDIRFLCRCTDQKKWFNVLTKYLDLEEEEGNWYSFLGTKYFKFNGKVSFGWVIIFDTENGSLEDMVMGIRSIFSKIYDSMRGNSDIGIEGVKVRLPHSVDPHFVSKTKALSKSVGS